MHLYPQVVLTAKAFCYILCSILSIIIKAIFGVNAKKRAHILCPKSLKIFSYQLFFFAKLPFYWHIISFSFSKNILAFYYEKKGKYEDGKTKMLFGLFFPRADAASIGLSPSSGIYHQKIRIMIVFWWGSFLTGWHKWGWLWRRCATNFSKLFTKLCSNSQLGRL